GTGRFVRAQWQEDRQKRPPAQLPTRDAAVSSECLASCWPLGIGPAPWVPSRAGPRSYNDVGGKAQVHLRRKTYPSFSFLLSRLPLTNLHWTAESPCTHLSQPPGRSDP